jgi:predicted ATPase
LSTLEKGLDAYRNTGAGLALPYYLSLLAAALSASGRIEEADSVLDDALTVVATSNDRCHEAEIYRARGVLALETDPRQAETQFHRALQIARSQGSKAWELRCALSLARLRRREGYAKAARDLLQPVYAGFTEGFSTPDLQDAKTLLAELELA